MRFMKIFDKIVCKNLIDKGWSKDHKYCAVTKDGHKYLLRISSRELLKNKESEFIKMNEIARMGIPMCIPLEFGTCEDGIYSIHSWIDGEDAENVIPLMSAKDQYKYGFDAGRILSKIHMIAAPSDLPEWEMRFNDKIDRKIAMYEACDLKFECEGDYFLRYITENRHLLAGRPQTYQHGDFHIGNLMVDRQGVITVIDFDRNDFGDPWEEFNRIVWSAQSAPAFASGMIDGYFDSNVPVLFWKLLALYICCNTLGSLPWAIPFGDDEILTMRKQAAQVLQWYDSMNQVVPSWYKSVC